MNNIPTAKEMGFNLASLSNLLCREELILPKSKGYLDAVSGKLKKQGRVQSYEYIVKETEPIDFIPIVSKKLERLAPRVYINVTVKSSEKKNVPQFEKLVTVIEVWDVLKKKLQLRWHICVECIVGNGMGSCKLTWNEVSLPRQVKLS